MPLTKVSSNKTFGGQLHKFKFESSSLGGLTTQVNVFLPAAASPSSKVPVLYYLAGLTCTEDTGAQKGGICDAASSAGLAVVFPDTSPRGASIEGEEDDWDFGTGAGFYLNATSDRFKKHYNMEKLITEELPRVLEEADLGLDSNRVSLMGHSMGGHGAVSIYLKSKGVFKSCSAFAPILNPTKCPWGEKAFKGYLASPETEGREHDSSELVDSSSIESPHILIHYGSSDDFYLKGQLLPENFERAVQAKGWDTKDVSIHKADGYDHSYFFVSTFMKQHVDFHARYL